MESYPKFHNEVGVPIVRIGCREFKCIGDKPPQDHPHIYLNMGDASENIASPNPAASWQARRPSGFPRPLKAGTEVPDMQAFLPAWRGPLRPLAALPRPWRWVKR
jgi:uncharacterized Zn-finger protein